MDGITRQQTADTIQAWADNHDIVFPPMPEIRASVVELRKSCAYTESDGWEYWDTTCGHQLVYEYSPPTHPFCPYCGGTTTYVPWVEPSDDEEEAE